MKIRAWRVQNQENLGLEGAAGVFFGLAARRRSKFWQKSTKDGAKTLKVSPKMRQEGAKMGVLGSTCEVLARSWPQSGRFWEVLGTILEAFWDIAGSVKTNNSTAFW